MLCFISVFMLVAGGSLWAQGQGQEQAQGQSQAQGQAAPLTENDVIKGLKSKNAGQVASQVSERGVAFDLTPEIEKRLRKAKADDTLIDLIRKAGPAARAGAGKMGGQAAGARISPEEYQAVQAIRDELDPDKRLQLVSDFEKKYPNSALLWFAYMFSSDAYRQKNDLDNMVLFGEKSLKLNPDNLASLVTVSSMIPQPQFLNVHPQEKEKYLNEADAYATRALTLIADPKALPKQPNESDEQYTKRKNELASGAHASLGLIHLERSEIALQGVVDKDELAKAETEYEQAISLSGRPAAQDYYRLGEAYAIDGKLDQAIQAFNKAADLGQGTVIKTFADQRIQELQKRKAQAPPGTKP
jgi:tetratricopeptide (TPR) repeat protein